MSSDNIEQVVEKLKYGGPETRKAAAIRLGRIRDKRVIPHLIRAMKEDGYSWTRISAIQSLLWIADPVIIEPLIEVAMEDNNELVRKTAIEALGNLKATEAIDKLNELINNPKTSEDIKQVASIAIQVIQGITPSWSQDVGV